MLNIHSSTIYLLRNCRRFVPRQNEAMKDVRNLKYFYVRNNLVEFETLVGFI
jgi:hypothetical protein